MDYIVLARKWRPQTFSQVVAQQHVVRAIQNAIKLHRLPHAILLTGSRGVGKTTIARLIAKTVNCENLPEKLDDSQLPNPCNSCTNCIEITEGRSVDVIEIDGASNRSIDDIRELRDNVQYLPTKARRKVYIIDEVHMLTREAFNALLKTLEEPPKHVLFIFATTEPNKIPITILSRCQRFDFKQIPTSELKKHLKNIAKSENIELSDRSLAIIARAAQGGMRDALSLLDQVISFAGTSPSEEEVAQAIGIADRNQLIQLLRYIVTSDLHNALKSIEQLLATAYDIRQLTADLAELLRDLMVVSISDKPLELTDLSEEELQTLRELSQKTDQHRIYQMFKILSRSAEEIARSNYPKLLLEMTVVQMARSQPLLPLNDAIKYLQNLEKKISSLLSESPPPTASPQPPSTQVQNLNRGDKSSDSPLGFSYHNYNIPESSREKKTTPSDSEGELRPALTGGNSPLIRPPSTPHSDSSPLSGPPVAHPASPLSGPPVAHPTFPLSGPPAAHSTPLPSDTSPVAGKSETARISLSAGEPQPSPIGETPLSAPHPSAGSTSAIGETPPSAPHPSAGSTSAIGETPPSAPHPSAGSSTYSAPDRTGGERVSPLGGTVSTPSSGDSRPPSEGDSGGRVPYSAEEVEKEIDRLWPEVVRELLEKLERERGSEQVILGSALKTANIKVEGNRLTLLPALPNNAEKLRSHLKDLQQLYKNRGIEVIIEVIGDSRRNGDIPGLRPSIQHREELLEKQKIKELREEVKNHPLVQSILKFAPKAKIVNIKPVNKKR